MKKKKGLYLVISAVILIAIVAASFLQSGLQAEEISKQDAQAFVTEVFSAMPGTYAQPSMKYLMEHSSVTVDEIEYGAQQDIILHCSFHTLDAGNVILEHVDELLNVETKDSVTGMDIVSTKLKGKIDAVLLPLLEQAKAIEKKGDLILYTTSEGLKLHTTDEAVDVYFGGVVTAKNEINELDSITVDGEQIKINANIKKGLLECFSLNYSTRQPDSSATLLKAWNNFKYDFNRNFMEDDNWKYITKGLATTAQITFFALLIGVVLGFVVAIVRCTYQSMMGDLRGIGGFFLRFINFICKTYLTILRGTPVLVQLMIIFFVIFMPLGIDKFLAAVICFGLNSGAYVAEIVRGGIMSVDHGQMEAGRSLGFGYVRTMIYIILPQTIKAVLPALANEFIVLLKETSVSAYIGINDLARGGDIIRGVTYSAFMPLIAVALIYLIVVIFLQYLVGILERRLQNNER